MTITLVPKTYFAIIGQLTRENGLGEGLRIFSPKAFPELELRGKCMAVPTLSLAFSLPKYLLRTKINVGVNAARAA